MRVVVAGSSGLIGSNLVPALRHAGHDVFRLVRRSPQAFDEYGWDPARGRVGDAALEGADAVINLCGAGIGDKRWNAERKRVLTESRISPTSVLANAVVRTGVGTLINGSAVGYYGDTGDEEITEDAANGSGFLAGLCQQWEDATEPASDGGVRVVRLRTGLVLSRSGGLLSQLTPLFSRMLGGRLGDGRQYMPWISLDDEIAAIRFALENSRVSGAVNLTGPAPVTNAQFTKSLAHVLGKPAPWVVPRFALRAVLGGFADEGALASQRVLPSVLTTHEFDFRHSDIDAALATAVAA